MLKEFKKKSGGSGGGSGSGSNEAQEQKNVEVDDVLDRVNKAIDKAGRLKRNVEERKQRQPQDRCGC